MTDNNWIKVAEECDFEEEDAICHIQEGRRIAVFCVEGSYYATDDLCTHEVASLSKGYIDGTTVECPLHQGVFCLKTGKALAAPAEEPVRTLAVKVEGSDIYVQV